MEIMKYMNLFGLGKRKVFLKKLRFFMCIVISIAVLVSSTLACFADVQGISTDEFAETVMINGEEYVLVPAPAPNTSQGDVQIMDVQHYDWKYSNTNKTNKHFDTIAKTLLITFMTGYLGESVPALVRMADFATGYYATKNLTSANIYYTKDFYYAENLGNYGGYPYYCKKVLYQYANSARTKALYDLPAISYYYAYQPY